MSDKENYEGEVYFPSEEVVKNANVPDYDTWYKQSIDDPEGFWADRANELEWYKKWDKVLDDSNAPFFKWFVGGKTNIVHNAIDRHLTNSHRNKLALIWEGEPGDKRTFSYHALDREVSKMSNILKSFNSIVFSRCALLWSGSPDFSTRTSMHSLNDP